jgi:hypothetical protein
VCGLPSRLALWSLLCRLGVPFATHAFAVCHGDAEEQTCSGRLCPDIDGETLMNYATRMELKRDLDLGNLERYPRGPALATRIFRAVESLKKKEKLEVCGVRRSEWPD